MPDLEHSILTSLDGTDPRLFPYLSELLQDLDDLGANPSLVDELLSRVPALPATLRVLDLGCGKGSVALYLLARHPWSALGLDGMPDFVARARERASAMGCADRARFEVADIRTWEGEGAFHLIVMGAVGPVLGDTEATLRHLDPWLEPGGLVVLDEVFLPEGHRCRNPAYARTRGELMADVQEAGFRVLGEQQEQADRAFDEHQAMFEAIRTRAESLARRHPEHRALFEAYVACQARAFEVLEQEVVDVTWLLGRA